MSRTTRSEIPVIGPAAHQRRNPAHHPDHPQQMVTVLMGDNHVMQPAVGDPGRFQARKDTVSASGVGQENPLPLALTSQGNYLLV